MFYRNKRKKSIKDASNKGPRIHQKDEDHTQKSSNTLKSPFGLGLNDNKNLCKLY